MKNFNKYKINFRNIYEHKYIDYRGNYRIDYIWDYKVPNYFRSPKCHRNKKLACSGYVRAKQNLSNIPDAWDDISISRRHLKSWKDRSKRRHQYKIEKDDFFVKIYYNLPL